MFQIKLRCTFIYAAFKARSKKRNALRAMAPTTTILPITTEACCSLNFFSQVIYEPQKSMQQYISKRFPRLSTEMT